MESQPAPAFLVPVHAPFVSGVNLGNSCTGSPPCSNQRKPSQVVGGEANREENGSLPEQNWVEVLSTDEHPGPDDKESDAATKSAGCPEPEPEHNGTPADHVTLIADQSRGHLFDWHAIPDEVGGIGSNGEIIDER